MTLTFNAAMSNPPVEPAQGTLGPNAVVRSSAGGPVAAQPAQMTPVAKLIDVSKCIGCKACQSACVEWNDLNPDMETFEGSYMNPHDLTPEMYTLMRFEEYDNPDTGNFEWLIRKDGCMHCEDPGCLTACPSPGAIVQYANGIVDFIHENCIGCGYCLTGCPFNIPRISQKDHKAYKCTLCSDRVDVGQGPACAKACPTMAITFGTKDEMTAQAAARVEDLKARGYANAGLYDPQGVKGTHVMYVLQHADKPQLYSNLPVEPKIASTVKGWKGPTKTVGLAALGLATVGALLHGLVARRNEATAEDEQRAADMVDDALDGTLRPENQEQV